MDKMSYKTFVWPQNPHTYQEECIREPHFVTVDQVKYFDEMGDMQRIITGQGTFFGDTAIADFQKLAKLFEDGNPGNLQHPQWGIRYCYFTGLELTQDPRENCVAYRFQFTQAKTNGEVPF
ncbi:MAG: DNA circularization N-terminal domain-containing protein [Faecousia sp.]